MLVLKIISFCLCGFILIQLLKRINIPFWKIFSLIIAVIVSFILDVTFFLESNWDLGFELLINLKDFDNSSGDLFLLFLWSVFSIPFLYKAFSSLKHIDSIFTIEERTKFKNRTR